jgi:hypothetical protein
MAGTQAANGKKNRGIFELAVLVMLAFFISMP